MGHPAAHPPRWVLFDYGNTLVPYGRREAAHVDRAIAARVAHWIPDVDADSYLPAVRRVTEQLLRDAHQTLREVTPAQLADALAREAGVAATPEGLAEDLAKCAGEAVLEILELPEATLPVLDRLRGRVSMGLVSNYYLEAPIHETLRRFGIADRLDMALVSCEVGRVKPHPAVFERALETLGAVASETVFVGDNLHADVGGARALGMRTVHTTQFQAGALHMDLPGGADLPQPDIVINHLNQLPGVLFGEESL